jgi:hypothetical protein
MVAQVLLAARPTVGQQGCGSGPGSNQARIERNMGTKMHSLQWLKIIINKQGVQAVTSKEKDQSPKCHSTCCHRGAAFHAVQSTDREN